MTTIACDGRTMAGDGLSVRGSVATNFDSVKVTQLPDGRIVGCAGEKPDCCRFVEWLITHGPTPKFKDMAALVLHPDGRLIYHTDSDPKGTATGTPNAIGSGCEIAIGAMLAGASPEKAVEIAATRDVCTGGQITVFTIPLCALKDAA